MKCSVIPRKEKNTISTENNMERTGKKLKSLKKPAAPAIEKEDPAQLRIHSQILVVARNSAKDNTPIFLNKCLVRAHVDQDHVVQNSEVRITRQNCIFP